MAAVIGVKTKKYEPIDPEKLRLVPHIQPSQKLLEGSSCNFWKPELEYFQLWMNSIDLSHQTFKCEMAGQTGL